MEMKCLGNGNEVSEISEMKFLKYLKIFVRFLSVLCAFVKPSACTPSSNGVW